MEIETKRLHIVWKQMKEEETFTSCVDDILSDLAKKEISKLEMSEVPNMNIDILDTKEDKQCF